MKLFQKALPLLLCAVTCTAAFAGCNGGSNTESGKGNGTLLNKPTIDFTLSGTEEEFYSVFQGANAFAAKFAPAALKEKGTDENYTVSPVSAYMALAIAAACTNGQSKEEIVSALGVDYQTLENGFPDFFRSVVKDRKDDFGEQAGMVTPVNSVWLQEGAPFKENCLQTLAEKYYSYSHAADFAGDNKNANLAVRNFVKEQTHDLIDKDFELSKETELVILNTLYLKDVWNDRGDELPLTQKEYGFACADGTTVKKQLMEGYYSAGRVHETKTYSTFFTKTRMGLKIKFIVPKKGHTVKEVFTADTLAEVNALSDYNAVDTKKKKEYYTRCLFPAYSASYNESLKEIMQEDFGIKEIFDGDVADFSAVSGNPNLYCTQMRHITKLEVERKGVEGAAVTIMVGEGTAVPDEPYQKIYEDFVVDQAFGFILCDNKGTTLFSGIVNKI